jgi:hypothetical protein
MLRPAYCGIGRGGELHLARSISGCDSLHFLWAVERK